MLGTESGAEACVAWGELEAPWAFSVSLETDPVVADKFVDVADGND